VTKKLEPQIIGIGSFVLLGLVVCAVGYFAVIAPERSKVGMLRDQIANAQTELTVAEGANARPAPFRASDLFRLAKAMPSANDMPGIVIELRNVAVQSSVELTSVRPGAPVTLALGYSALPLAVTVVGKYTAVSRFMDLLRNDVRLLGATRLEVSGRLFDADSIQLQAAAKGDSLTATLALDAFVYSGNILPSPAVTNGQSTGTTGSTTTSTSTTATTATTTTATTASGSGG
jgi:Tfp pilus assembly protein PilO